MFASRKQFAELGYKVQYQSLIDYFPIFKGRVQKGLEQNSLQSACKGHRDIVMLAFHHSTSDFCQLATKKRCEILIEIKKHCNMLVWLDTADSTGTCMFDVMPYVDLYFKKQLLVNTDDYCRDVYGSRTFCEFYHNTIGKDDESITSRHYPHTEKRYLHKLRVAWNIVIGDLYASPLQLILHPFGVKRPLFISPDADRPLDVQYRGRGYSPVAGYPRNESRRLVQQIKGITVSDVTKLIPKKEYVKEGQISKAILSPFGWGEICGRDFEAFVYGACMIKQDMSHCITYPHAYQKGITYIPLKWDFSDFNEKVSLAASKEYKNIARQAQEWYKYYFTKKARKEFAKHIINELERK